ncbi:MAG TPA: hypothetical protein VEL75_19155, partial [Candidatus Methylomirabilis sp.]|nr:hypothetical protein [Candidatus Methylomirabilis sp.]
SHSPVSFLLFLGVPALAAAAAGALLGPPLVVAAAPRSGWWAACRGAAIGIVALVLFAPMFAVVSKLAEPGWTSLAGLAALVLWLSFIAAGWMVMAVGAVMGLALRRWARRRQDVPRAEKGG